MPFLDDSPVLETPQWILWSSHLLLHISVLLLLLFYYFHSFLRLFFWPHSLPIYFCCIPFDNFLHSFHQCYLLISLRRLMPRGSFFLLDLGCLFAYGKRNYKELRFLQPSMGFRGRWLHCGVLTQRAVISSWAPHMSESMAFLSGKLISPKETLAGGEWAS